MIQFIIHRFCNLILKEKSDSVLPAKIFVFPGHFVCSLVFVINLCSELVSEFLMST